MYKFGELKDEKMAKRICQELTAKGISSDISLNESRSFDLYVHDEQNVPKAFDYYRVKLGIAKPIEIDQEWINIKKAPLGKVTKILIIVSVFITILYFIPSTKYLYSYLMISNPGADTPRALFADVLNGEIWRLITPIFLHFNFIHIFFNMMWTKDLGSLIEDEKGSKNFLILVFLSALIPNILQYITMYYFVSPIAAGRFGGMSGVVFALLGFIWMNKTFNKEAKYSLPKRDVTFMIAWYFICMTGVFGPIANIAHGAGLGLGMIYGIFTNSIAAVKTLKVIKYNLYALFFIIGTVLIEVLKFKLIYK